MSDGRVGPLVAALADGVRADLEEIGTALSEVRAKIETLGEASGAINGLSESCNGWGAHISELERQVEKESRETVAKLLGQAIPPIAQFVNTELAGQVRTAKEKPAA